MPRARTGRSCRGRGPSSGFSRGPADFSGATSEDGWCAPRPSSSERAHFERAQRGFPVAAGYAPVNPARDATSSRRRKWRAGVRTRDRNQLLKGPTDAFTRRSCEPAPWETCSRPKNDATKPGWTETVLCGRNLLGKGPANTAGHFRECLPRASALAQPRIKNLPNGRGGAAHCSTNLSRSFAAPGDRGTATALRRGLTPAPWRGTATHGRPRTSSLAAALRTTSSSSLTPGPVVQRRRRRHRRESRSDAFFPRRSAHAEVFRR